MQPLKEEMIVQDHVAELHKKVRYKLPHSVLYNEWRMKKLDGLVDWKERKHWTVLDNGCGIAKDSFHRLKRSKTRKPICIGQAFVFAHKSQQEICYC
jgi:hypothetical protein